MSTPTLVHAIGNRIATTLSSGINSSALSISVASGSGLNSTGGYIIIDKGLATQEIIYVESVSGTTLTVASDGRGRGGTTASAHSSGAIVNDVLVNEHIEGLITAFTTEHSSTGVHSIINSAIVASGSNASSSNKLIDYTTEASGWLAAGETWVYASWTAGTHIGTFTIAGVDKTSKYYVGMRVKITQSTGGIKYGIITKSAFSTDTTITVDFGTDYTLNNEAISSPYFSLAKVPAGFPVDPNKYSLTTTDTSNRTQATPANANWYNLGSVSLTLGIGVYYLSYQVGAYAQRALTAGTNPVYTTLSTTNSTESDSDFTAKVGNDKDTLRSGGTAFREKVVVVTTPTTYYLNTKVDLAGLDELGNNNAETKLIIRAINAYL